MALLASATWQDWLTLLACVGQLALAALAIRRGAESPLAGPLALLCVSLFSWNFAALAHRVSGVEAWRYLDVALSPLSAPLALYFVVAFVGRRRALRRQMALAFVFFGALSGASLSALVLPAARAFSGSAAWAAVLFPGAVVTLLYAVRLLVDYLRACRDPEELVRTRLVFLALCVGGALAVTELLADLGLDVPRGGSLGALAAACVLAVVALRFHLLERELSSRALAYSLALGALAVVAYLGVFHFFSTSEAMLVIGTITVTLGLVVAARQMTHALVSQREQLERYAVLGRFSAQMAHDLKNPIAALKGALQYLGEELSRGRPLDEQKEFVDLLSEEVERIRDVVDRYQRLGGVEPAPERASINEIVDSVLSLQPFAAGRKTKIERALDDELPACRVDRDLLARALENLISNAFDALPPGGGTVRVSTERGDRRGAVLLTVEDDGRGMDPRTAERAFDEFFTTKTQGSGLGLYFVQRVARAHGGEITLTTQPGRGTRARLSLPAA